MVAPANPYAAPEVADAQAQRRDVLAPPSLFSASWRWGLICVLSAAPSFVFGLQATNHFLAVPLMLLGVAAFAFLYIVVDRSPPWRRLMANTKSRNCIIGAYGLRVSVSILLPVGWVNDMLCGSVSIQIVGGLFGSAGTNITNPAQILLTTMMQGVLLNLEVLAAVALFYSAATAYRMVFPAREALPETQQAAADV